MPNSTAFSEIYFAFVKKKKKEKSYSISQFLNKNSLQFYAFQNENAFSNESKSNLFRFEYSFNEKKRLKCLLKFKNEF